MINILEANIYELTTVVHQLLLLLLLQCFSSSCNWRRASRPAVSVAVGRCARVATTTGCYERRSSDGVESVERAGVVDVQAAGDQEREAGRHAVPLVHLPRGAGELRAGDEARRGRAAAGRLRRRRRRPSAAAAAAAAAAVTAQRRPRTDRRPHAARRPVQRLTSNRFATEKSNKTEIGMCRRDTKGSIKKLHAVK